MSNAGARVKRRMTAPAIHVIGSVNIDHMYECSQLPLNGKCVRTDGYRREIGGKGLNQAFALFKAGWSNLKFCGCVGSDGEWILDHLKAEHFPVENIEINNQATGNCLILRREHDGHENATALFIGANKLITMEICNRFLKSAKPSDILIVQNETNHVSEMLQCAKSKDMITVFNPAPIPPQICAETWRKDYPTDILILNLSEAHQMFENFGRPQTIHSTTECFLEVSRQLLADVGARMVIMTCGAQGSCVVTRDGQSAFAPAFDCQVVDTTGAGDTFLGFFLEKVFGMDTTDEVVLKEALSVANAAASLSISMQGALVSIPAKSKVERLTNANN